MKAKFDEYLQSGIFAVTGKPGAGKSYFSVSCILAEIKGKNRNIVTNIPVNRKNIREKVGKDFYIYELQTFTDNHLFFTQRGDYAYELEQGDSQTIDFSKYLQEHDRGVVYIIDEAHLYFNSRNWKFMSLATLSFFTFIRHCGDTLIYLTQKFSDVDAQLRGKTQSFNLLRNLDKERLGFLKRGKGFRIYQYMSESDIGTGQKATQDFQFPFEKSIGECYSTSLFNRNFDVKNKVRGITIKQVAVVCIILIIGFLWWIGSGGIVDTAKGFLPDMVGDSIDITEKTVVHGLQATSAQAAVEELVDYEIPVSVLPNYGDRFQLISVSAAKRFDALIFGSTRTCKLSFFVEKIHSERGYDFSFDVMWSKFFKAQTLAANVSSYGGAISTEVFSAFASYVRDNSEGTTLKEVTLILKEAVPCVLSQGYEIPLARTIATEGVSTTNYEYRQVGFDMILVMETINQKDLISVQVNNTQILDYSVAVPTMLSFKSQNVYDVEKGNTYEIAEFQSKVLETNRKLFGKKDIQRVVNNRVFLSFGL